MHIYIFILLICYQSIFSSTLHPVAHEWQAHIFKIAKITTFDEKKQNNFITFAKNYEQKWQNRYFR